MPVLWDKDIDRSELTINIAKSLFNEYDFNEGQKAIINSANYRANVIQRTTGTVRGPIWEVNSRITSYNLDIQFSHPEAVDEATSNVLEDTKGYIQELFNQNNFVDKGTYGDYVQVENEQYFGVLREVGLIGLFV
jgi:hypothetical protein